MSSSIELVRGRVIESLPQTKVLVTGGRYWTDKERLERELDRLHFLHDFTDLAHGDAGQFNPFTREVMCGVDKMAGAWAKTRDIRVQKFPVTDKDWTKYGNDAGPRRNRFMFDTFKPQYVIVFPGGSGTRDMMVYSMSKGAELLYV